MFYIIAAIFTLTAWAIQACVTAIGRTNRLTPFLPIFYSVSCALFMVEAIISRDVLYIILNAILLALLVITAVFLLRLKQT